jgi:hypothetical protein
MLYGPGWKRNNEVRLCYLLSFTYQFIHHIPGPSNHRATDRGRSPMNASSASSAYSIRGTSLSRQLSTDDVPEDEPVHPQLPSTSSPPSPATSEAYDRRGRRNSRFSFATVSNVIFDAVKERVRSSSPHIRAGRDLTLSKERRSDPSRDSRTATSRGRPLAPKEQHNKISAFSKFGEILKLDADEKESGNGWKEFKKGACLIPKVFSCSHVYRHLHLPYIFCNPWRLSADS